LLFAILNILVRFSAVRERRGVSTGVFLIGYGLARSFVELFRQPDVQIGFLTGGSTMGQWLSAPMIVIRVGLVVYAIFKKPSGYFVAGYNRGWSFWYGPCPLAVH
jgi:phosphatidylglycerol---prolipoprotein diacylglyceryl transferase